MQAAGEGKRVFGTSYFLALRVMFVELRDGHRFGLETATEIGLGSVGNSELRRKAQGNTSLYQTPSTTDFFTWMLDPTFTIPPPTGSLIVLWSTVAVQKEA